MLFDFSLEIPTILSTLEWLDFGKIVKQSLEDLEELTGTLWKKPRLPSNPKIFEYSPKSSISIERSIPA